ncbi:hypothetical protein GTW37_38205 [Streptomyces sp. SID4931]|nr:hypothetical protein [Streptomyces sp. SID4931]SCG09875.1 hypothetical protein GA0115255_126276 [Streptomyces sp. Ncost-T6T-2b]
MAELTFCAHCTVIAPSAPAVMVPRGPTMRPAAVMPTPIGVPGAYRVSLIDPVPSLTPRVMAPGVQ